MEKRKMNKTRKTAVFASVLTVFIALMSIAPVFAKPYNVTVIVKNADGTPATNVWVRITSENPSTGLYQVNSRGKVVIPLTNDFQPSQVCWAEVFPSSAWGTVLGFSSPFSLNKKASGRVTVTLST